MSKRQILVTALLSSIFTLSTMAGTMLFLWQATAAPLAQQGRQAM